MRSILSLKPRKIPQAPIEYPLPQSWHTMSDEDRQSWRAQVMRDWIPYLFATPVPLAIGIRQRLLAHHGRSLSGQQMQSFLRRWTKRPEYLEQIAAGVERIDL